MTDFPKNPTEEEYAQASILLGCDARELLKDRARLNHLQMQSHGLPWTYKKLSEPRVGYSLHNLSHITTNFQGNRSVRSVIDNSIMELLENINSAFQPK